MFKWFSRKFFWKSLFIFSACGALLVLKTAKPSSRYNPMSFLLHSFESWWSTKLLATSFYILQVSNRALYIQKLHQLDVYLSIHLSISIYLSIYLSIYIYIYIKLRTQTIYKATYKGHNSSSSSISTLALEDLHLIWAALMSCQRAKQERSIEWLCITLLNFVNLSTQLIKNGNHKRYATLITLAVAVVSCGFSIICFNNEFWITFMNCESNTTFNIISYTRHETKRN